MQNEYKFFIRFLKDNNIYYSYFYYLSRGEHKTKIELLENINSLGGFLDVAFDWYHTDEGFNFWCEKNFMWYNLYVNL